MSVKIVVHLNADSMEFKTRHISNKIIELTVETFNTRIVEDVVNLKGRVPEDLIENIENVLEDLKAFNEQFEE